MGGLLGGGERGGGGGQRVCWPLSQIIGGGGWLPPGPLFLRLCPEVSPHASHCYFVIVNDHDKPTLSLGFKQNGFDHLGKGFPSPISRRGSKG